MLFRWQLLSIPTYTKSLEPFTSHDLTRKSHRASLDLHTFLAKHCATSSISEHIPRELAQVCLHSLFDVSNSRFYSLFWCLESPILAPTITASRDLVHFSLCFHGASRHKGMASASKVWRITMFRELWRWTWWFSSLPCLIAFLTKILAKTRK